MLLKKTADLSESVSFFTTVMICGMLSVHDEESKLLPISRDSFRPSTFTDIAAAASSEGHHSIIF
jgi:hypothetical protein